MADVLPDEFGVDRVHQEGHVVRDDVHDAAVVFVDDGDVGVPGPPVGSDVAVGLSAGRQDSRE